MKILNSKFKILNSLPDHSGQEGFLALMSAIIISAVLAVVVFSVSFAGFMTRFNILDSEYKARSYVLAEGYAGNALIILAQGLALNPSYSGTGGNVAISGTTADYYSVSITGGSAVTINSHSVVQGATTNINISGTYSGGSFIVNSWKEVP
jgi:hypothetical protein